MFADVVAAFYSVIRQLVMQSREEASLEAPLHDLHVSDSVKEKMWSAAASVSLLETAGVTPDLEPGSGRDAQFPSRPF